MVVCKSKECWSFFPASKSSIQPRHRFTNNCWSSSDPVQSLHLLSDSVVSETDTTHAQQHHDPTFHDPGPWPHGTRIYLHRFQSFILSMIRRRPAMSGPAERWTAQAYTVKLQLQSSCFLARCRAPFPPPAHQTLPSGACWRGDAILREVKSDAGPTDCCLE